MGSHNLPRGLTPSRETQLTPPRKDECALFLPVPKSEQCYNRKAPRGHPFVMVRNTRHAHTVQAEEVRTHTCLRVPHLPPQQCAHRLLGTWGPGRWQRRARGSGQALLAGTDRAHRGTSNQVRRAPGTPHSSGEQDFPGTCA